MGKRGKSKIEPKRDLRPEAASHGTQNTSDVPFAIAAVALLALTALVFAPVARYGFVSLDDHFFVEGRMRDGLTLENLRWVFSGFHFGFYNPVTLVTHLADRQVFGDWAGGHHLMNLVLHLANTLLLLAILMQSTKARWRSLFVAALFAVHPLHVEAVAWVSERKELLCTLFEFLAVFAYIRYVQKPYLRRYAVIFLLFALALLSKSMAITFPFLLLLLDYWPLGRLDFDGGAAGGFRTLGRLTREKLPLFALIPVASWVTLTAQSGMEALAPGDRLPLAERLANAGLAYGWYSLKMIFPSHLTAYYPHTRGAFSTPLLALSLCFLAAASLAALWFGRRYPYFPACWFWYLGTLVPVIGVVQVGAQAWADRYSYITLVGLFIILSWGICDVIPRGTPRRTLALTCSACLVVFALAATAREQVKIWSSSEVLYRDILRHDPRCPVALVSLANDLGKQKRFGGAVEFYEKAGRVTRLTPASKLDWAYCLSQIGRDEEAVVCFQSALPEDPGAGQAYFQFAFCLSKLQRHAEAIPNYRKAYALKAVPAATLVKVGDAYRTSGLCREATEVYGIVLVEDPKNQAARQGIAACGGKP